MRKSGFPSHFSCAVVSWVTRAGNGNDCFLPASALKTGDEVRCRGRTMFLCFHHVLCNVRFTASSVLFHLWFSVSWSDGYHLPYMSAPFLQDSSWKIKVTRLGVRASSGLYLIAYLLDVRLNSDLTSLYLTRGRQQLWRKLTWVKSSIKNIISLNAQEGKSIMVRKLKLSTGFKVHLKGRVLYFRSLYFPFCFNNTYFLIA